jgi:hypothetical protein
VAATGSATSNLQAEMMYLLRRHILGRNFFPGRIACITFPKRSGVITPSASKRPMRRSSGSTMTMASYPGELAQAKLDAREGRTRNIQLGFASQRLVAMGDALISQSTGRSAATFCPNGGSAQCGLSGDRPAASARKGEPWPAAGSADTEIGCFRKPEARDAEAKVQSRVQDRGGPFGA